MRVSNGHPLAGSAALLAFWCLAAAAAYAGGDYSVVRFYAGPATLNDAEGVVGLHHEYRFACTWDLSRHEFADFESYAKLTTMTDRGWIIYGGQVTVYYQGTCLGRAHWDRKSLEAVEDVDFIRGNDVSQAKKKYFGTRVVKGKCFADPFIGGALCQGMQVSWKIPSWDGGAGPIGNALADDVQSPSLVAYRGFDVSMAKDLSALHKDDPKPPQSTTPPTQPSSVGAPAGPQSPVEQAVVGPVAPTRSADTGVRARAMIDSTSVLEVPPGAAQSRRVPQQSDRPAASDASRDPPSVSMRARSSQAPLAIEAEQLVQTGRASAGGGQVVAQSMTAYGAGWSNDAQAFWGRGAIGAVLDLIVEVPTEARYEVEVHLSRAPDYGDLRFEVDGRASPVTFSGYAPSVTGPTPLSLGAFDLGPGPRRVSIMITGRQRPSTGFWAGIDRVVLRPVGSR